MDDYYDDPDYDPEDTEDTQGHNIIIVDTEEDTDEVIYHIPSGDDGSDHTNSGSEPEEDYGMGNLPHEEDMQMSPPDSPTLLTADYPQPFGEAVCTSTPHKPAAAAAGPSKQPVDETTDEDGQTCTICFEQWTNSSEHRLVSLRCGHLFGRSCITRWLKGQNARCPQCNARARKSEIRNIYAKAVKVMDSTERDQALLDLKKESELRRKAEMDAAQQRLQLMMSVQECQRLKKELSETNRLLQEYRCGMKAMDKTQAAKPGMSVFCLEKCIEIAKNGGCRIVAVCGTLDMALVTQPSTNELFSGYGFRKISTYDMKPAEFILVHQKAIKDMAFHKQDGLVLTASLDKTVKITNVITNSVVHSYSVNDDAWSCAWDGDDDHYFYAGLKNGLTYLFDVRVTSRYVHELPSFGRRSPVTALQYLNRNACSGHSKSGPVVATLFDCGFYQKESPAGNYKTIPFPTSGPYASLNFESFTRHFLVSSRPSAKQPRVTHTVCELVSDPSRQELTCNPVHTIFGGRTQVQLQRSKLLPHPEDPSSLLICAGDDEAHGALIWDGSSGKCLDHLKTESSVLDITDINKEHCKSHLFTLTDKTLRLYSWNGHQK